MSGEQPAGRPLICLVDDEVGVLAAVSAAIRSRGDYDVQGFDRAAAFLAFVRAPATNCLVTDYKMPALSGLQLVREVRRRQWTFPVVVSSGLAGDIRRGFAGLNVAAFIEKNAGSDLLIATVFQLLQPLP
ncbi:response regulator [Aurantimonas sp. 22II-16-19i]|uniref:response regulator n=1 Tax=Aurantimonas sp. 22II-16-19i TaxID=1317114 RepID=UPI0009F7C379|nr:response regulator [Aurantimonas sp. 22II-16-19i]ORE90381.1 response regulator receiver domain-containing protein [Aurantimonas sp. 22II-16-19i]